MRPRDAEAAVRVAHAPPALAAEPGAPFTALVFTLSSLLAVGARARPPSSEAVSGMEPAAEDGFDKRGCSRPTNMSQNTARSQQAVNLVPSPKTGQQPYHGTIPAGTRQVQPAQLRHYRGIYMGPAANQRMNVDLIQANSAIAYVIPASAVKQAADSRCFCLYQGQHDEHNIEQCA